jgi:hypothetical protein
VFRVNGTDTRLYYIASAGAGFGDEVFELGWDNGWFVNQLTGANGIVGPDPKLGFAPAPAPGSALACFGVNGVKGIESRVYYFDANNNVIELAVFLGDSDHVLLGGFLWTWTRL